MDSCAEIDAFCNRVNEVSSLIANLKNNAISDNEIHTSPYQKCVIATSQHPPGASLDDRRKVKQLLKRQQVKERRRGQFREYLTTQDSRRNVGTDYRQWELWCPSDEDDEVVNSCTPSNPTFKALEKDVQTRHESATRERQIAERARIAGNVEFKQGRFAEAYRHYISGLEIQKHDITLQSNAAMASLKTGSYAQAILHCNKVLGIANNLLNKPHHALCLKALQRRSIAHKSLGQHKAALSDLQEALTMDSDNAEIQEEVKWLEQYLKLDHDAKALLKGNKQRDEVVQLKKLLELVSKTIENWVRNKQTRLVFVQLGGVPLFAKILKFWPQLAEDVFRVLSLICVDELVLETLTKTDEFFKSVFFQSIVISEEDKKDLLSEGSLSFLLAVARYKQGRRKLLSTLFKPPSTLTEQLLRYINSNEQVLSLFLELFVESEGRKLFCKEAKLLDILLQVTREALVNSTRGVTCLERSWQICALLSSLTSSKLIRKRIWKEKDLVQTIIKACVFSYENGNFDGLKSIVALFGNCLIDADPLVLTHEADMNQLVQTLKHLLRTKTTSDSLHLISITTLARLAAVESLKKKILEGKFAETVIELCPDSASPEKLKSASFKLLARLRIEDLANLHSDMQSRLIDLCREVILNSSDQASQGNAILTLSNIAKLPTVKHDFADTKLIKTLINLAHEEGGITRRNSAICLASLSQRSSVFEIIRKHHGIEILHNAIKETN